MEMKQIFSPSFLAAYTGSTKARQPIGTLNGCTIRIQNLSKWGVKVYRGQDQIDYVPAYFYVVMPNYAEVSLELDTSAMSDYSYMEPSVQVKSIEELKAYQHGAIFNSMTQVPGGVFNVAGDVNIGNVVQAQIQSGTVNIGNTVTANIAAGSVNATIQNAQLDTQILNASLTTNQTIMVSASVSVSNLDPGGYLPAGIPGGVPVPLGVYSAVIVRAKSTGAYTYSLMSTDLFILDNSGISHFTSITQGFNIQAYFDSPQISNLIQVAVKNAGTQTIVSDTLTFFIYLVPLHSLTGYTSNTTDLGSYSIPSEVIGGNGGMGITYSTPSLVIQNVKRMQLLIQSNGTGYVVGSAGVRFKLQVSNDNVTWYDSGGNTTYPNNFRISTSGLERGAFDSALMPQMIQGYKYVRFIIFHQNDTAGSLTMANSSIVITAVNQT